MSSTSETGHIKNIENLDEMISIITSMGATYAPINPLIAKAALVTKKTVSNTTMINEGIGLITYKNAVNARDANYKLMSSLSTRVMASLESCGAKADIIKDAQGIKNKIEGKRTGEKPVLPEKAHSVSQMSFDQRKASFALLVALVAAEPKYNPNETDLKVSALTTYVSSLQPMNKAVDDALSNLNHLRELRDIEIYAPVTGIVDLSKVVKSYVRSVVGTSNTVYKHIVKLKFRNKKI